MIRIAKTATGPQLFLGRFRCHHFHIGLAAILAGAYLVAVDRRDFVDWLIR